MHHRSFVILRFTFGGIILLKLKLIRTHIKSPINITQTLAFLKQSYMSGSWSNFNSPKLSVLHGRSANGHIEIDAIDGVVEYSD